LDGLTYRGLAEQLGVKLCQGNWYGEVGTPEPDHVRGFADRQVHWWPERRVTRTGLRKFLMLVAATKLHGYNDMSPAMRLYATNARAVMLAADLRIRIPRRYADGDRARARWLISQGQVVTPAARRWASRTPKEG
jgi:D-mannonate dehydratase